MRFPSIVYKYPGQPRPAQFSKCSPLQDIAQYHHMYSADIHHKYRVSPVYAAHPEFPDSTPTPASLSDLTERYETNQNSKPNTLIICRMCVE